MSDTPTEAKPQPMTTAQAYGAFRRELIAEGFSEEAAEHMAVERNRGAAHDPGYGLLVSSANADDVSKTEG